MLLDITKKYLLLFMTFLYLSTVIGYVASAGHGIAAACTGDEKDIQRARRACAAGTKAVISTGATVGGGLIGGPLGM